MWKPTEWHWTESVRDFSTKLLENNSVLLFPLGHHRFCAYILFIFIILLQEKDECYMDEILRHAVGVCPPSTPLCHFFSGWKPNGIIDREKPARDLSTDGDKNRSREYCVLVEEK